MRTSYFHTNAPLQIGMRGVWREGENLEGGESREKQVQGRVRCYRPMKKNYIKHDPIYFF